jgi:hypothetical protein
MNVPHSGTYMGLADFIQHVLGDVDRDHRRDAQRDRVAGSAVDLDVLAVLLDVDAGEEGVVLQVVDLDGGDLPAEASMTLASRSCVSGRGVGMPFKRRSIA